MAVVQPFRALRPPAALAQSVASLPYDVMNVAEARAMAAGNDVSFLHISRPEIDLAADIDPCDDAVYEKGRANLEAFIEQGTLVLDATPTFSVYRQRMGEQVQTGIVAVAAIDDYESGVIAKHEFTRPDKELDRVRHIDALEAQDEPVFLLCARQDAVEDVIAQVTRRVPQLDMVTDDGIGHTLWIVADANEVKLLTDAFAQVSRLYVADGHHRSAAASQVRELRRQRGTAERGWAHDDGFMVVIFAADELVILPYHRTVADLAGQTTEELLARLDDTFEVTTADGPPQPSVRHVVGMYLAGQWYRLALRDGRVDVTDPVARLDVSVLQDLVLAPLLNIGDPRTDARLRFVGGIRGTRELERAVDDGGCAVSFALHPTSVTDLIALADDGRIMPPKSTWFEPKLRSGLFAHILAD